MKITIHGHNSVQLLDKKASIVINNQVANKNLLTPEAISISTNPDIDQPGHECKKHLHYPGEYEISGVYTEAMLTDKHNTVFTFIYNGIRYCHLGGLEKELTDKMLEKIGNIDILFLNGGNTTEGAKKAHIIMEQIDPSVVIPLNMNEGTTFFIKETGKEAPEHKEVFTVNSRSSLPTDHTEIVILSEV